MLQQTFSSSRSSHYLWNAKQFIYENLLLNDPNVITNNNNKGERGSLVGNILTKNFQKGHNLSSFLV